MIDAVVVKVQDLQIDDEYGTITPQQTIQEAAIIIREKKVSYLIALEGKNAKGLLSDRDILEKVVAEGKPVTETTVKDVMSPIIEVTKEDTADYCLEKLAEHRLPALAVVNEAKELIGVVTLTDCLGAGTIFDLSEDHLA